jgi:hypothetical protein
MEMYEVVSSPAVTSASAKGAHCVGSGRENQEITGCKAAETDRRGPGVW